ncbi:MAG: hypothetical protein M3R00_00005, partial [Pseudomonadota bacterium]|nr:hypothetical protein [Pseudomonadota bacterium]
MQEHINRQKLREHAIDQASKQKRLESLLDDLARNPLSISAFPLAKDYEDYESGEWLRAWDYINENVLNPSSQTLHRFLATALCASDDIHQQGFTDQCNRLKKLVDNFDKMVFEILEPHNDATSWEIYVQLRMIYLDPI